MTDNTNKRQMDKDVFTTEAEAKSRSFDMGLGGDIHVYDIDGQGYYMPGESHDAYLRHLGASLPLEEPQTTVNVSITINKEDTMEGKILKVDEEQQIIYGWASVATLKGEHIVDHQEDVIKMDVLEKAVNDFMENVRVGKTMHVGEQTGIVLHSMPLSKEICSALDIQSDMEGWVVGYKVYDSEVWDMVKTGKLRAFSIGGRAVKESHDG
jgi:hypothetical protein